MSKSFLIALLSAVFVSQVYGEISFYLLQKDDRVTIVVTKSEEAIPEVLVGKIMHIGLSTITIVTSEGKEIGILKEHIKEIDRHEGHEVKHEVKSEVKPEVVISAPVVKTEVVIPAPVVKTKVIPSKKSAFLAGFLSLLIPGVGNFYAGDNAGGFIFLGSNITVNSLIIDKAQNRGGSYFDAIGNPDYYEVRHLTVAAVLINVASVVSAVASAKSHNAEVDKQFTISPTVTKMGTMVVAQVKF